MIQEDFEKILISMLAGIAEMKNEKEVWYIDEFERKVAVEFPTGEVNFAIVRQYYDNGNRAWETEYRNCKRNGYSTNWYENGTFAVKFLYKDDDLVYETREFR